MYPVSLATIITLPLENNTVFACRLQLAALIYASSLWERASSLRIILKSRYHPQ
jgi:hypothetical protein